MGYEQQQQHEPQTIPAASASCKAVLSHLAKAHVIGLAAARCSDPPPGGGLETGPTGGPPFHGRIPQLHLYMPHLYINADHHFRLLECKFVLQNLIITKHQKPGHFQNNTKIDDMLTAVNDTVWASKTGCKVHCCFQYFSVSTVQLLM